MWPSVPDCRTAFSHRMGEIQHSLTQNTAKGKYNNTIQVLGDENPVLTSKRAVFIDMLTMPKGCSCLHEIVCECAVLRMKLELCGCVHILIIVTRTTSMDYTGTND